MRKETVSIELTMERFMVSLRDLSRPILLFSVSPTFLSLCSLKNGIDSPFGLILMSKNITDSFATIGAFEEAFQQTVDWFAKHL